MSARGKGLAIVATCWVAGIVVLVIRGVATRGYKVKTSCPAGQITCGLERTFNAGQFWGWAAVLTVAALVAVVIVSVVTSER